MIYEEVKSIAKDYSLFPDERIKKLQVIDIYGVNKISRREMYPP